MNEFNCRMEEAKERINELKGNTIKNFLVRITEKKQIKQTNSLRVL